MESNLCEINEHATNFKWKSFESRIAMSKKSQAINLRKETNEAFESKKLSKSKIFKEVGLHPMNQKEIPKEESENQYSPGPFFLSNV
jgi:hypothetical protein